MQEKEENRMILRRKIFVSPDYYKNLNLNEAEEDWLKGKRSGLAKKYNNLRKDKDRGKDKKKLLGDLKKELSQAEATIQGKIKSGPRKYIKEAVNKAAVTKENEARVAKEIAEKELRYDRLFRQAELLKKKKLGKNIKTGILIGTGIGLGAGLGYKVVKTKRENNKKENIKKQILR